MRTKRFARSIAAWIAAWCAASGAQPPGADGALPLDSASPPPASDDEPWFIEQDCQLCHQVDVRAIGPAYTDIASRYPATDETIEALAAHVVEGSVGRWGDTPMTPHAALDLDQAREMVKRILALAAKR